LASIKMRADVDGEDFTRKTCFDPDLIVVKATIIRVKTECDTENEWPVPLARKRVADEVASHEIH
jgi:hypothetical protein